MFLKIRTFINKIIFRFSVKLYRIIDPKKSRFNKNLWEYWTNVARLHTNSEMVQNFLYWELTSRPRWKES